jgi:hypothetical protein
LLKKILYNNANAKFQTKPTINQTTGRSTQIIGFAPSSGAVSHQRADNVANNKTATQIHTTTPKRILPKNDHAVTSFGVLSNIGTSGLLLALEFCHN